MCVLVILLHFINLLINSREFVYWSWALSMDLMIPVPHSLHERTVKFGSSSGMGISFSFITFLFGGKKMLMIFMIFMNYYDFHELCRFIFMLVDMLLWSVITLLFLHTRLDAIFDELVAFNDRAKVSVAHCYFFDMTVFEDFDGFIFVLTFRNKVRFSYIYDVTKSFSFFF